MYHNYNKKNNFLKEIDKIKQKYIKDFEKKENKNKFFCNNYVLKNNKTNKTFTIKNNIEDYIKSYFNTIIQRLIYNKEISKKEGLVPFFVTFTLPSEYHPFKTFYNGKKLKKKRINPKYKFNSIEEGVPQSYKKLVSVFRSFYKQLKDNRKYRTEMKKMRYNYFIEYHKSFVPHLHLLVFLPNVPKIDEYVKKIFLNTIKKNNLNIKGNKLIKIQNKGELDSLDGSVLYISKYISKSLEQIKKDKKELKLYWGWKSFNNIRIFRGNNIKIGIKGYKKIYHNLTPKEKEGMLKEVKKNKSCLLLEIEKRTMKHSCVIDMKTGEVETKKIRGLNNNNDNLIYEIFETKEKHIKKQYKLIYKLFSIVKDLDYLNYNYQCFVRNNRNPIFGKSEPMDKYISLKEIIERLGKKTNLKTKTIKKYFNIFKDYIYIFEKEIDKNKLDNIVLDLKHKQHIIKKIIFELFEVIKEETEIYRTKYVKELKKDLGNGWYRRNTEEFDYYLNDLRKIIGDLGFFKSLLNKKIEEIFFYVTYYVTDYKIFKNGIEIYNKNNFKIVKIKE